MSEKILMKDFERIETKTSARHLAETSLLLGQVAMNFSRVERIPRYNHGERESDVEHSFMLALVAPELAQKLELPLDSGLLTQFALVHDLIELKTGDVATFVLSEEELHQKEQREKQALEELLIELPPHTAHLLARYEHQAESEARFVRFVDKLLPLVVDIIGDGKRVMQEDYGIHTQEALAAAHQAVHERLHKKFGTEFPAIAHTHSELMQLFEARVTFSE